MRFGRTHPANMTVYAEYIGTAVLSGLWITPLSILWFISLCLARRKKDPARVGIAWMKAVFPFWVLYEPPPVSPVCACRILSRWN